MLNFGPAVSENVLATSSLLLHETKFGPAGQFSDGRMVNCGLPISEIAALSNIQR